MPSGNALPKLHLHDGSARRSVEPEWTTFSAS